MGWIHFAMKKKEMVSTIDPGILWSPWRMDHAGLIFFSSVCKWRQCYTPLWKNNNEFVCDMMKNKTDKIISLRLLNNFMPQEKKIVARNHLELDWTWLRLSQSWNFLTCCLVLKGQWHKSSTTRKRCQRSRWQRGHNNDYATKTLTQILKASHTP